MAITWQQLFENGNLLFAGRLFDGAELKYLEALDFARNEGDQSWVGDSLRALARTYLLMDRPEDAEKAATEAEQVDRSFWGYENQQVADDIFLLAEAKHIGRNLDQARALFERTLEARISLFSEDHNDVLEVLIRLLWIDLEEGDSRGKLIGNMQQATATFLRLHPRGGFARALNVPALLKPYLDHEMPSEALLISERLQKAMRTVLGNAHPEIAQVLADSSDVLQVANNQLSALRQKSKPDVVKKTTAADLWLAQMEGNEAMGDISPARGTINPASNARSDLPNTQTGAPPPNHSAQPNPFPTPNPFASGFPAAPPSTPPQANPIPLPNLFPSDSSAPPAKPYPQANPDANLNPSASSGLSSSASPNMPADRVTPHLSAAASPQVPAIGHPKIDLSELTKRKDSLQPEPSSERGGLLEAALAKAGIGIDSKHFTLASSAQRAAKKVFEWQSRQKTANDLRRELSYFLDLVIKYVEKGVSVAQAVQQVSKSASGSCPTLCRELERSLNNLKSFTSATPRAFGQVGKEYGVQELIELAGTLEAAERTKSSLAYQLREQSKALKNRLKNQGTTRGACGLVVILVCLYLLAYLCGFARH